MDRPAINAQFLGNVPLTLAAFMSPLHLLPPGNPSGTPVRDPLLPGTQWFRPGCRRWGLRLGKGYGDLPPSSQEHLVQRRAGILDQMKTISHLDGIGRSSPRSIGVSLRSIAYDHLHTGMLAQPVSQGLGFASGQEVNRLAPFQVDQDGGIGLAPAQRQIIDSQHPWRLDFAMITPSEQPEQRIWTNRHAGSTRQSSAGFASHHPGQLEEEGLSIGRALCTLW
jgi:hypothetical protein